MPLFKLLQQSLSLTVPRLPGGYCRSYMTVKEEKCSVEEAAASYALDRERAYQKLRCGAHADRE
jgi:hypothetical protein